MSRPSAVRFSHFLPSLLLLFAGLAAAYVKDLNVFFTSLFNVLPTLVLLLGGAYCAVYRRQRELFLMVTVYIAYFLLDTQTDYYRDNGQVRADAAVIFHLCCLSGHGGAFCRATGVQQRGGGAGAKLSTSAAQLAGRNSLASAAWQLDEPDPVVVPRISDRFCTAGLAILA